MALRAFGFAGLCAVLLAGLVGCSSDPAGKNVEDTATVESELTLVGVNYLGTIANGQTKTSYYYNPPRYRAYGFTAKANDRITVDVKSLNGDAMGWITSSGYTVLAANDDASYYTLDSKVTYKVPAGTPTRSYRIVFRDYDLLDATFTVKLSIQSAATCSYNGSTYQQGQTFPSTDHCNTCTCTSSGVACTEMACVCNPANEPWRDYVGTPEQCMVIRYTCPVGQTPFSNSCGCGCE
jgi:hypothetical protein